MLNDLDFLQSVIDESSFNVPKKFPQKTEATKRRTIDYGKKTPHCDNCAGELTSYHGHALYYGEEIVLCSARCLHAIRKAWNPTLAVERTAQPTLERLKFTAGVIACGIVGFLLYYF